MSAIVRSRRQIASAVAAQAVSGPQGAPAARALPREHARDTSATAARAVGRLESMLYLLSATSALLVRASVAHR